MTLTSKSQEIAQTQYVVKNDSTKSYNITYDLSGNTLTKVSG